MSQKAALIATVTAPHQIRWRSQRAPHSGGHRRRGYRRGVTNWLLARCGADSAGRPGESSNDGPARRRRRWTRRTAAGQLGGKSSCLCITESIVVPFTKCTTRLRAKRSSLTDLRHRLNNLLHLGLVSTSGYALNSYHSKQAFLLRILRQKAHCDT